jgi:anhydro-N-acetylmuramic acid kinase
MTSAQKNSSFFIGIMSGTSLDGADAVLTQFNVSPESALTCETIASHSVAFDGTLRQSLMDLHHSGHNELERTALISNQLAHIYAQAVEGLIHKTKTPKKDILAIGCHGQTIRHRPELGFTLQIGNAALLAELTDISVVSDFRSRDIAAGGQGAPLVPAFHQAVFGDSTRNRIIINIGGIANLSILPSHGQVIGFDSGPGNMLMDAWAEQHINQRYDQSGRWAMTGKVINELLSQLLNEAFFKLSPPKSTGRDLFSLPWLQQYLKPTYSPQDVQRTLLAFTAETISNAVKEYGQNVDEIYLCGGGAYNVALFECLRQLLHPVKITLTDDLGIKVDLVEAVAFAWLARQTLLNEPGNLPDVTGARGPRVLGAIYAR